jgi:hypothetical protein
MITLGLRWRRRQQDGKKFHYLCCSQDIPPSLNHQGGEEVAEVYFTVPTLYTSGKSCNLGSAQSATSTVRPPTCYTVPITARFLDINKRCKICSIPLYNFCPKHTADRWLFGPLQLRRL